MEVLPVDWAQVKINEDINGDWRIASKAFDICKWFLSGKWFFINMSHLMKH